MAAMVYKWLVVSCLWFAVGSPTAEVATVKPAKHPFYIAVTEINLNTADKTLEISCKMFAEDLEQIIEKNNKVQLDISSDNDKKNFDTYIPAYVKKHLSISID